MSDMIRRTLEYNDYIVKQVINITDVGHLVSDEDDGEDKLEKAANESGESAQAIAEKYTNLFFKDLVRLNVQTEGTQFPKATDYVAEQIAMIQTLTESGHAYRITDGVYFDTSVFKNYGQLGGVDTKTLEAGVRVKKNEEKRNPADFALWKCSPEGVRRQQEWKSPWCVGFPGWHIECSAMSRALLGRQLDIHSGGIDHIPVHHNNEIAQSESVNKKQFVQYWMHNNFITVEGRRMGKSQGNLITLDHVIDRGYAPLSYRYWLLTAHYRTPANFTWEALDGSHTALKKLHKYFIDELGAKDGTVDVAYQEKFHTFLNDDLDTPKAIALMWELVKDDRVFAEDKRATLLEMSKVLGLGLAASDTSLTQLLTGNAKKIEIAHAPEKIQELVAEREEARAQKNFDHADDLRQAILDAGYEITDGADGPSVERLS
tara:strand:+ start:30554 stop:31846 length:1293 start_codon:yes stop_codon:yes gene_type:complete